MQSNEIRDKFLKFFEKKGHKIIPSASLVPQGDISVLFTTAGMQQFKPYYTAPENAVKDFGSQNVTSVQKCIRTSDIDEVGDATHLTFFEMLGNFSFGGYGKKEAIEYAYEFITKELSLQIDYVSVFKDDENKIPADEESRKIWQEIDSNLEIREHNKEDNFWGPTGDEGPCGPTTEIYIGGVEIWNIVFNEYYKSNKGEYTKLPVLGIDTGMGLERLLVQVQKARNVYETDLFESLIQEVENRSKNYDEKSARIIADHIKTAVMLISDGVMPANINRGYVLRRLIRRAVRFSNNLDMKSDSLYYIASLIVEIYKENYSNILTNSRMIFDEIKKEENKFRETLERGLKEFEKGVDPFVLFTSYGFPIELTQELATEKGVKIDLEDFKNKMLEHQKLSQTSSAGIFKGGLANHNEKTIRLHTAHHLLLRALQEKLGNEVKQRGSNITEERLRMDFSFYRKLTDEEKRWIEERVNNLIKEGIPVIKREMSFIEAEKIGAEMEFGAKYPEKVSVYFIERPNGEIISKEFCGGPHVQNTKEIGVNSDGTPQYFKILKEEASSTGVRRIKAVVE